MDEVVFITPFGVKKAKKFQHYGIYDKLYTPQKSIAIIKATAITSGSEKTGLVCLPAIAKTVPKPDKFILKEDITMLSTEERIQRANKRISIEERQLKLNAKAEKLAAEKKRAKPSFRNWRISFEILSEAFSP